MSSQRGANLSATVFNDYLYQRQPNMALLDLPAELLRVILHRLDPASFYTCLQTAKIFRQHALLSTSLLCAQLARVPGQRVIAEYIKADAIALMKLFCRRATQHLCHGVQRSADVHLWRAERSVNRKISGILTWNAAEQAGESLKSMAGAKDFENTLLLAEVRKKDGSVTLYSIKDGKPVFEHCISRQMLNDYLPPVEDFFRKGLEDIDYDYSIMKVVPLRKFRYDGPDTPVKIAILYKPPIFYESWRIICFSLDPFDGPAIFDIRYIDPPEIGETFIDMIMDAVPAPFLLWRRGTKRNGCLPTHYRVTSYNASDDQDNDTTTLDLFGEHRAEYVSRMRFQDTTGNLQLLSSSIPMPLYTMDRDHNDNELRPIGTYLPTGSEAFSSDCPGRTIATHHHHNIEIADLNDGHRTCVNTALRLVITNESLPQSREGGFLLKALQYPEECVPFDKGAAYPRLDHVFVAQLANLPDLHNLSTLGLILAISPRGHRIAIASWRTLLVYSLDPQAFLDPEYSLSQAIAPSCAADGTMQTGVPGDYAFIEGCGWQYYANGDFHDECVVLQPVELECTGVVFGLEWKGEDELWGWGEEGLVMWRMGAQGKGKRWEEVLGPW